MADPTISYIKTLAEEAIAARDLANDCLPIEYHDYSNKAMAAHEKYWNALGKLQPDDFLALTTALENARKDAFEEPGIGFFDAVGRALCAAYEKDGPDQLTDEFRAWNEARKAP